MEKQKLASFNRQLSRMYSLAILHVMISVMGLGLNYFRFHNGWFLYVGILSLNLIALVCFQPWKIMGCLSEGHSYKLGLEMLSNQKGRKEKCLVG